MEDFEYAAVHDALKSLANDVSAVAARKRAEVMGMALKAYYVTEELSRDPEHAHLIEHVERMRAAYEREFGRPIPPKGEEVNSFIGETRPIHGRTEQSGRGILTKCANA